MVNVVLLEGNLVKEPLLKYAESGTAITTFRVAVDRDKSKEGKDKADWLNIVCFGKVAESVAEYLTTGSHVLINGRLQSRSWEDSDGKKQYSTEVAAYTVTFLDKKKGDCCRTSEKAAF